MAEKPQIVLELAEPQDVGPGATPMVLQLDRQASTVTPHEGGEAIRFDHVFASDGRRELYTAEVAPIVGRFISGTTGGTVVVAGSTHEQIEESLLGCGGLSMELQRSPKQLGAFGASATASPAGLIPMVMQQLTSVDQFSTGDRSIQWVVSVLCVIDGTAPTPRAVGQQQVKRLRPFSLIVRSPVDVISVCEALRRQLSKLWPAESNGQSGRHLVCSIARDSEGMEIDNIKPMDSRPVLRIVAFGVVEPGNLAPLYALERTLRLRVPSLSSQSGRRAGTTDQARDIMLACSDCKLTYQLRGSLGPSSPFVMVVAVCPLMENATQVVAALQAASKIYQSTLPHHPKTSARSRAAHLMRICTTRILHYSLRSKFKRWHDFCLLQGVIETKILWFVRLQSSRVYARVLSQWRECTQIIASTVALYQRRQKRAALRGWSLVANREQVMHIRSKQVGNAIRMMASERQHMIVLSTFVLWQSSVIESGRKFWHTKASIIYLRWQCSVMRSILCCWRKLTRYKTKALGRMLMSIGRSEEAVLADAFSSWVDLQRKIQSATKAAIKLFGGRRLMCMGRALNCWVDRTKRSIIVDKCMHQLMARCSSHVIATHFVLWTQTVKRIQYLRRTMCRLVSANEQNAKCNTFAAWKLHSNHVGRSRYTCKAIGRKLNSMLMMSIFVRWTEAAKQLDQTRRKVVQNMMQLSLRHAYFLWRDETRAKSKKRYDQLQAEMHHGILLQAVNRGKQRLETLSIFAAWRHYSVRRQSKQTANDLKEMRLEVESLLTLHEETRRGREQAHHFAAIAGEEQTQHELEVQARHNSELEALTRSNESLKLALESALEEITELRSWRQLDAGATTRLRGQLLHAQRTNTRLCEQLLHLEA